MLHHGCLEISDGIMS
ncbi:hypothetical protein GQ600_10676 [Phytophthora cactorum]|nr:hypothetical protein GQ600_10676 [Phytophthora cactorum]